MVRSPQVPSKGFIILPLIIVIALIIGGGGFWYSQKSAESKTSVQEVEKKANKPQALQQSIGGDQSQIPQGFSSWEEFCKSQPIDSRCMANKQQQSQQQSTGIPPSDPEAGSVYIYIADHASCGSTPEECERTGYLDARVIRIDDLTGKNWVSFGTFGKGVNQFVWPFHITVGPDGKIYVADAANDRIIRIDDMTGKGWVTYGVSGRTGEINTPSQVVLPPGEGRLVQPSAVKLDSMGRIYILSGAQLARIDDMTGKGWTTFGSGVNQFFKGKGLGIDSKDRIYIIDAGNHRVVRIDDMTGKGWVTFGTKGSGVGQFEIESNGGVLDAQDRIYIADEHNNRLVRIDDMTGKGWVEFGGLPNDSFNAPHDLAITKAGRIYISDTANHRVVRIDDMTGKGWIAFAPYVNLLAREHKWVMEAPYGIFVVER